MADKAKQEKPKTEKPKQEKPKTEKPKQEKPKQEKPKGGEKPKAGGEKPKEKAPKKSKEEIQAEKAEAKLNKKLGAAGGGAAAPAAAKAADTKGKVESPAEKKQREKREKRKARKKAVKVALRAPPKPGEENTALKKSGGPAKKVVKKDPFHHSLAHGLKKGFGIRKRTQPTRPASHKGAITKRVRLIKDIIREVSGFAPYEKRVLELLRNNLDKRALKYSKKKLGTHSRGKRKREELSGVLQKMRAGHHF
jgi:large subunit ribosomal protein L36e